MAPLRAGTARPPPDGGPRGAPHEDPWEVPFARAVCRPRLRSGVSLSRSLETTARVGFAAAGQMDSSSRYSALPTMGAYLSDRDSFVELELEVMWIPSLRVEHTLKKSTCSGSVISRTSPSVRVDRAASPS